MLQDSAWVDIRCMVYKKCCNWPVSSIVSILSIITGKLFDVNVSSEYVETIIAKCIDHYTKLRVGNAEADEQYQTTIDARYVILYVRYS